MRGVVIFLALGLLVATVHAATQSGLSSDVTTLEPNPDQTDVSQMTSQMITERPAITSTEFKDAGLTSSKVNERDTTSDSTLHATTLDPSISTTEYQTSNPGPDPTLAPTPGTPQPETTPSPPEPTQSNTEPTQSNTTTVSDAGITMTTTRVEIETTVTQQDDLTTMIPMISKVDPRLTTEEETTNSTVSGKPVSNVSMPAWTSTQRDGITDYAVLTSSALPLTSDTSVKPTGVSNTTISMHVSDYSSTASSQIGDSVTTVQTSVTEPMTTVTPEDRTADVVELTTSPPGYLTTSMSDFTNTGSSMLTNNLTNVPQTTTVALQSSSVRETETSTDGLAQTDDSVSVYPTTMSVQSETSVPSMISQTLPESTDIELTTTFPPAINITSITTNPVEVTTSSESSSNTVTIATEVYVNVTESSMATTTESYDDTTLEPSSLTSEDMDNFTTSSQSVTRDTNVTFTSGLDNVTTTEGTEVFSSEITTSTPANFNDTIVPSSTIIPLTTVVSEESNLTVTVFSPTTESAFTEDVDFENATISTPLFEKTNVTLATTPSILPNSTEGVTTDYFLPNSTESVTTSYVHVEVSTTEFDDSNVTETSFPSLDFNITTTSAPMYSTSEFILPNSTEGVTTDYFRPNSTESVTTGYVEVSTTEFEVDSNVTETSFPSLNFNITTTSAPMYSTSEFITPNSTELQGVTTDIPISTTEFEQDFNDTETQFPSTEFNMTTSAPMYSTSDVVSSNITVYFNLSSSTSEAPFQTNSTDYFYVSTTPVYEDTENATDVVSVFQTTDLYNATTEPTSAYFNVSSTTIESTTIESTTIESTEVLGNASTTVNATDFYPTVAPSTEFATDDNETSTLDTFMNMTTPVIPITSTTDSNMTGFTDDITTIATTPVTVTNQTEGVATNITTDITPDTTMHVTDFATSMPEFNTTAVPQVTTNISTEIFTNATTTVEDSTSVFTNATTTVEASTFVFTNATTTVEDSTFVVTSTPILVTPNTTDVFINATLNDTTPIMPTTPSSEGFVSTVVTELFNVTTESPSNDTMAMTTQPPTGTTELMLNTSDSFESYWMKTVIKVKPKEDETQYSWWKTIESRLAKVYSRAFERKRLMDSGQYQPIRRKRATRYENITLQMINVTRPPSNSGWDTNLVYYMHRHGNLTEAAEALVAINVMHPQEVAMELGYFVITPGEIYAPPPPEEQQDSMLWIIGVVLGSILLLFLLVWGILFVYFKCTRPRTYATSPQHHKAKPTDSELVSYRHKDIKGFDVARTELGLEQSYRQRGSNEYEGMYSPGEGSPPRTDEHTQQRSSGRAQEPLPPVPENGSIQKPPIKEEPVYAVPRRKKKGQVAVEVEAETDTSESHTDHHDDRRPLAKSRTKGDHRQHGTDKEARVVSKSVHPIKFPEIREQAPDNKTSEGVELADSLRHKADIEHYKNKQRQRQHKHRKHKHGPGDQRDIDEVLDPEALPDVAYRRPHKRSRKRERRERPADDRGMEMREMKPAVTRVQGADLGTLETDSDEAPEKATPELERTRNRMHALLDEVFTLATYPKSGPESHRSTDDRDKPTDTGPRHEPMRFDGERPTRPHSAYNPYTAADEAARIMEQDGPSHRSAWSEPPAPGHTNQAYMASPTDIATEPGPPIQIATQSLDRHPPRAADHTNMAFSSSMFAAQPSLAQGGNFREPQRPPHHAEVHKQQRPHSAIPNGKPHSQPSPRARNAWGTGEDSHDHKQTTQDKNLSRIDIEPGDDELDIAQKAAMGHSPEPLISSIREEIQRLASRTTH